MTRVGELRRDPVRLVAKVSRPIVQQDRRICAAEVPDEQIDRSIAVHVSGGRSVTEIPPLREIRRGVHEFPAGSRQDECVLVAERRRGILSFIRDKHVGASITVEVSHHQPPRLERAGNVSLKNRCGFVGERAVAVVDEHRYREPLPRLVDRASGQYVRTTVTIEVTDGEEVHGRHGGWIGGNDVPRLRRWSVFR